MAELVTGPLISALVEKLVNKKGPQIIEFFKGNHVDEENLQTFKMLLVSTARVLSDAEEKQFIIDPIVKEWLDRLKDAMYDADDVLDKFFTGLCDESTPHYLPPIPFKEYIGTKVKNIIDRLKLLLEHKDLLDLKEGGGDRFQSIFLPTTSLVDESQVHGRFFDKEKIIEYLLSSKSNGVVAIVGLEGIGKTTLAQIVYNDKRVRDNFDALSWISVSEASNVVEITSNIITSLGMRQSTNSDLNLLQINLKLILARRKFLVVLDGFWSDGFVEWELLKRPLLTGKWGSRIIVTSRSKNVATAIRADLIYSLPILSHEDIWKIFSSHAFESENENKPPVFTQIGHEIVRKCGGLPLAALTLGSLLRSKEDEEQWERIRDSSLWELPSSNNNIFSALKLRYTSLPSYLKQCFVFCSIFPKGYRIDKWNLIYLWMSEGFLPQPTQGKSIESVGEECFEELLSRSFFHRLMDNQSCYVIHDLFSDLAQYIAGHFCHVLESSASASEITQGSVRHVSYLQGVYDSNIEKLEQISNCKLLKTFLPFKCSPVTLASFDITQFVLKKIPNLKCLRVFSISRYAVTSLPDSIGNLIHLRYLDFSFTSIKSLPDSICTLYNLETLLLSNCNDLTRLPENISNLVNLRQLDISHSAVTEMPTNFGNLKSLQMLTTFIVGGGDGSKVSELSELSELHGSLSIENLQNVNVEEASNANLKSKKYLRELKLRWTTTTHNEEIETNVVEMLEPHNNVKYLEIFDFGGLKLPNWLGSCNSRIVTLLLNGCESCLSLTSLGDLPFLEDLCIMKMTRLQEIGPEFHGNVVQPFRSLKVLKFEDCGKLAKFPEGGLVAPRLESLTINRCADLVEWGLEAMTSVNSLDISGLLHLTSLEHTGIQHLKSLQVLRINDCVNLSSLPLGPVISSLSILIIKACPVLQKLCKENEEYKIVISSIPSVETDD